MFKNIWYDYRKSQIHLWEQIKGENLYSVINYVPYFFVPDKSGMIKSIYEEPVRKVFSETYQSHNKKQENIFNDGTKVYENKMKPEIQFLVDRYYKIPDIDFTPPKLNVVSIDIEVLFDGGFSHDFIEKALGKITIISLNVLNENKTYVFGLHQYKGKYCNDEHIVYYNCGTEEKLLKAFYIFLKKIKPDVITGWNSTLFDMYYIINRSKIILGEKSYLNLSPAKNVYVKHNRIDGNVDSISIAGIELLDYMELYKWYSPNNLERHTLEFVSTYELEKGKIDYSEYKDLNDLYRNNWDLYVTYNIIDALRVAQLEQKLGYIKLVQTLSLLTKAPMKHYQSMTMLLEGLILTYCRRHNLCAPTFKGGQQETFEAAWVKDPQAGKFKWITDLDITSSYPSHIITLNMSTETYYGRIYGMSEDEVIENVKNKSFPEDFLLNKNGKMIRIRGENLIKFNRMIELKRISITPCGTIFTNGKAGLISSFEKELFIRRKETKKIMFDVEKKGDDPEKSQQLDRLQNAYKSMLNSMFGITSVPYSRYYNLDLAEAIVSCGRNTVKSGQKFVNELLNNPNDKLTEILNRMKNE